MAKSSHPDDGATVRHTADAAEVAEHRLRIVAAVLATAQQEIDLLSKEFGDAVESAYRLGRHDERSRWLEDLEPSAPVDDRDAVRDTVDAAIGVPQRPQLRLVHAGEVS